MRHPHWHLGILTVAALLSAGPGLAAEIASVEADLPMRFVDHRLRQEIAKATPSRVAAPSSDTTFVGYNPAYAGSNYWSIGVGNRRPIAGGDNSRSGYWDFEAPIHGDSLQGWSPHRRIWAISAGPSLPDDQRPWWAADFGNQTSIAGKSGAPNAYGQKRTDGVIGMWHPDPGNVIAAAIPGTNPVAPSWAPLVGQRSAWCGMRGHGDLTAFDPITGNFYNAATNTQTSLNGSGNGTGVNQKMPGYCGQWDQMLYRDVIIPSSGTIQVRFTYRTNMSTGVGTFSDTRTGWFDKDHLTVAAGNYVKSSGNPTPPADSFMVYVGRPVEPIPGAANDWTGSDGSLHDVADPLRRWLAEVVHAFDGSHHELFASAGDNAVTTVTRTIDAAALAAQGYDGVARLVFRVKTNRGFDDDGGSSGGYSSGYAGAAVLDDIAMDTGSGFVTIGSFEAPASPADSALTIDNDPAHGASARWKATARPPGVYMHRHDLATLQYDDLCGPLGSTTRRCNMTGGVVSMGDHDRGEALGGEPGMIASEREVTEAIVSPVINLMTEGPSTPNGMGLTGDMVNATGDIYIYYEIYGAALAAFTYGNTWQFGFQSYPATQSDGSKCWGLVRYPGFSYQDSPPASCHGVLDAARANGTLRTSNASGIPDSIRIAIRRIGGCYRFGITTNCNATVGAYVDNMSLVFVDAKGKPRIVADHLQLFQDAFPFNETAGLPGTAAFDTCAALIQTGRNIQPNWSHPVAGDSAVVGTEGTSVRMDLVFRINPGPGNYVVAGDRSSGLRARPDNPAAIASGDGSFWSEYLANHGERAGVFEHATTGAFAARWNPLAWNSARMDTVDLFVHPVQSYPQLTFTPGTWWASTYHEDDPHFSTLGLLRKMCFLLSTTATFPWVATCGGANEAPWPPSWTTSLPATTTGIPPGMMSREMTKILPDGLFTPGTHVQYFFRAETSEGTALMPDTARVSPQEDERSLDMHRWQQFAVLPDAWKKSQYGGLGQACYLVLDWEDRGGSEGLWSGAADTLGLTLPDRHGAHNGWHAASNQDPNDPAARVYRNAQAGTHWDLYNVKDDETSIPPTGTIGSRRAPRETSPLAPAFGKAPRNAPTLEMLSAYYKNVVLLMGSNYGTFVMGPHGNQPADDRGMLHDWLAASTLENTRYLWTIGSAFVESFDSDPWLLNFGVGLLSDSYLISFGGVGCLDLAPATGSPVGFSNLCVIQSQGDDVLTALGNGTVAATYGVGSGLASSVFHPATESEPWVTYTDGFDLGDLVSPNCASTVGRIAYLGHVLNTYLGTPCGVILEPVEPPAAAMSDAFALRNTPLRFGNLGVELALSQPDRVTVRILDISGRIVRTLANRQEFQAGPHHLAWDARDEHGRLAPHGVYFAKTTYEASGFTAARKAILLR